RSLDRDFPLGRSLLPRPVAGTMPSPQDLLDSFQIQGCPAAINQRLKNLIHLATDFKDQVAAVFQLIDRILVVKPALLLLLQVEGKAQASAINPTVADLAQLPYSSGVEQGVCKLSQASEVGNLSKAVTLFGKTKAALASLAGHVLMTVQNHLGRKR